MIDSEVSIGVRQGKAGARVGGILTAGESADRIVVFAHGSGSSRFSPRNRFVANALNAAGFATLLVDLLTPDEEAQDRLTGRFRFDIPLLARRLTDATDWIASTAIFAAVPVGYFGASTGAAAALVAAADRAERVFALVSRGGRPDLAGAVLARVHAPTLMIVGGNDPLVLALNRQAIAAMTAPAELAVVEGATHLFEEAGALERVAELAGAWFVRQRAAGATLRG